MEEALNNPHRRSRKTTVLIHAAAALFFAYIFGISMNFSLNDPDLWWHLRTGEYIVQNLQIPDVDPFTFTTPRPLSEGQVAGLRAHWLGQVVFYISFFIGDYMGIIVFRNILIVLPMVILYIWFVKKGLNPLSALIVLIPSSLMLSTELFYSFERPQGISFLLAPVIVICLEGLRSKAQALKGFDLKEIAKELKFYIIAMPLSMALWANFHSGFIVGDVIIMLYLAGEALVFAFRKIRSGAGRDGFLAFSLVAVMSIVASFVNPNTYKLFYDYLGGLIAMFYADIARPASETGWVQDFVLEYKPLYYFYKELYYDWLVFYWAMTGLLFLLLGVKYLLKRMVDVTEILVVAFIVFFSNYYARGLMFSLTILPFYIGRALIDVGKPVMPFRFAYRTGIALMIALSVAFLTYSYRAMPYVLKPAVTEAEVTPWYPVEAVQFIKENKIQSPMYNFYTWGGFLIWSLYPEHRIFIDGRALEDNINKTADAILKAFPGWRESLDAYNINFVLIPVVFRESGHMIPLAAALADERDWKLVYLKNNSAIFVRDVPHNGSLIYKFNLDKKNVYKEVINIENIFLFSSPSNPVFNIAKADALFSLGMYSEANAIYEKFPGQAEHQLRKLKEMGY